MKRRAFIERSIVCCSALAVGQTAMATAKSGHEIQIGDILVSDKDNSLLLKVSELVMENGLLIAAPQDPKTGEVRVGSRFNKIVIVKLDPERMDSKTKKLAVDGGYVAFSGICTHQGCDVNAWIEKTDSLFCFCHYSQFDPYKAGKVKVGPAQRRLPMLPIEIVDDRFVVSGDFTGRVGGA